MCGIAGLWRPAGASEDTLRGLASRMTDAMWRRGPDDGGVWIDAHAGLSLGHRRLAVVDLGPSGAQPQMSADGRWVVSYGGELYNAAELRDRLTRSGVRFRGRSDTEVLLEAVAAWGLERTLAMADGMFAVALWDRHDHQLYLARDRFGEKPLVYGWSGAGPERTFVFASDLRAVRALPFGPRDIDVQAAALMLHYGYVPAPRTIHAHYRKLEPGTWLRLDGSGASCAGRYWDAVAEAERAAANRLTDLSLPEAVDELDRLVCAAVTSRMTADVPVGAFLSGGIDSSLVAAVMQRASRRPVPTFSVGMPDPFDESAYARTVAGHLGTEHHALRLDAAAALELMPKLTGIYDEPFGDTSQIPTYLVSETARRHVTVALTGDAGDEIFLGYQHYTWMHRQWRSLQRVPAPLRKAGGSVIAQLGAARLSRFLDRAEPLLPRPLKGISPGRIDRVAQALLARRFIDLYKVPIGTTVPAPSRIPRPDRAAIAADTPLTEPAEWASLIDTMTSLPDDMLAKIDRASMAAGLEARAPFLDPGIFRFVWSLPTPLRIDGTTPKAMLKEVLYRYVPRALVDRPKMGFAIPRTEWLRGPFRPWGHDLFGSLDGSVLDAIVGSDVVLGTWRDHQDRPRGYDSWLWHALALRAFELDMHAQRGTAPATRA